jgi:RNA polymerase sigma-32 factor
MREDEKSLSLDEAGRIAQTLEVKPEEVLDMQVRLSGADTPLEGPSGESEDEERFAPIDWLTRDEDTPTSVLQEKARDRLSSEGLARAMDALDERSREVIFARYLNEDGEGNLAPKTLQELATRFGVSIERVRQIEKKAIQKMHEALKGDSDIIEG